MTVPLAGADAADPLVYLPHRVGALDLRNENEIGSLGHNRSQVLQSQWQLVDPDHALRSHEVHAAERVSHQQPGRVLLGRVHRVLQVEDHAVGSMQPGVDHELRLVAGEIETRAPQSITGSGAAASDRALGPRVACGLGACTPGGRLDPRGDGEGERPHVVDCHAPSRDAHRAQNLLAQIANRRAVQRADLGAELDLEAACVRNLQGDVKVGADIFT